MSWPYVPQTSSRVDGPRVLGVVDGGVGEANPAGGVVLLALGPGDQEPEGYVLREIGLNKDINKVIRAIL